MNSTTFMTPLLNKASHITTAGPSFLIKESRGMTTFAAICIIAIIILGVFGNMLTIAALLRYPRLRSTTAAFIISLSVADLLFCVINLPFSASRFIHQKWIHGDDMCVLFPFLRYVNVGVSLLSITSITVNRYILIAHHPLYERIYRPPCIAAMIAFIWLFSIAVVSPTLAGKWGRFGYDHAIMNCSILPVNGRSAKTFLFMLGFVVPCVTIVLGYARIFWVLHRSQTRIRKHSVTKEQEVDRSDREKKEDLRITKMVLAIFCSFVMCYLPITIVKIADKKVRYPTVHIISYLLIYMSACINPIIYGVTNRQYRLAYKAILLCRSQRAILSSTSHTHQGASGVGRTMLSVSPTEENDSVFDDEV